MKKQITTTRFLTMITIGMILSPVGRAQSNAPIHTTFEGKATSSAQGKSVFLKSKEGAFFQQVISDKNMTITGGDEKGRKLSLIISGSSKDLVQGTLKLGNKTVTASGPGNQLVAMLFKKAQALPDYNNILPVSQSLTDLALATSKDANVLKSIVGVPAAPGGIPAGATAKGKIKKKVIVKTETTWCDIVCNGCANSGSVFSCLACAGCEITGN